MRITWEKYNLFTPELELHKCVESESYTITIQNSTQPNSNSIPNNCDWDSTIDIKKLTKTDSNSHWSQSQPQVWIIFHS